MKTFRIVTFALALAAVSSSCFLTSGQFQIVADFPDPTTIAGPTALGGVAVDLNQYSDYSNNKDKLKNIEDLALLGQVANLTSSATSVEVWMVPDPGSSLLSTEAAVRAAPGAARVWGAFALGPNETKKINWNQSATLFAGRQALVSEIKGDGRFDLYAIGAGGAYAFRIDKGAFVVLISAGV